MRIVIAGDGKVGSALTELLVAEGHDIVVIDNSRKVLLDAQEESDVMVVQGNGAALQVQQDAGVGESDLFIAVTSSDETNILSCILARKLGCRHTIARIRNPQYRKQLFYLKEELGLNMAVNPEFSAAQEIFRMLQFPSFLKRDAFAKGLVEIVQIQLREGNRLIDKKLMEIDKIAKVRVLVCAVEREDKTYIPDGKFKLRLGDIIYVTASSVDLAKLIRNLGLDRRKVRDVTIVGGGSIGYYLAKELLSAGVDVKIIEKSESRAEDLASQLSGAVIINADGTDKYILDSEGIKDTDAFVTLTGMDEENMVTSMYADYLGVPKVITKMSRTEYFEVFKNKGILSVVSPKILASHEIAHYVRAMQNTIAEEAVITMHYMGDMEALEFRATANTMHLGETLTDVKLKPGILVACINRNGKIIIPRGSDIVEEGDTVIVVTTVDKPVYDLDEIFAEPDRRRRSNAEVRE